MSGERKTALYDTHLSHGARMVMFGGWLMPVSYSGITAEHNAVRQAVGLFDVSHMGELLVTGDGALDLVQALTLNDAGRLRDGQAQYSVMATDAGTIVDDLLVYRFGPDRFMLVVNAANIAKDLGWIEERSPSGARVSDVSDETALVAVQGPLAEATLSPLVPDTLAIIEPFHFIRTSVGGVDGTLSRTGYTGEDGFEFYFPVRHAVPVWDAILEAGRGNGILEAGLGARNTLRLEAGMLLYGNDIDETTSALEAGLGWMIRFDKGPFVGRDALLAERTAGSARKRVGFRMTGPGIARDGYPVLLDGDQVGHVTSGGPSVSLGTRIGMTYLPRSRARKGTSFQVRVRQRLSDAEVVGLPFYQRSSS